MLNWLIQTYDAHPALARGIPPRGVLSAGEQQQFAALSVAKRRREWLLGRWTAKRLIQHVVTTPDQALRLAAIEIDRLPTGAPVAAAFPLTLSISHAGDRALCAVWPAAWGGLGADVERIAPRSASFAGDYFTTAELAFLARQAPDAVTSALRDTLVTAIWAIKEAALKALQLGLTVDTRSVVCHMESVDLTAAADWQPVAITPDRRRLGDDCPVLRGWWRLQEPFVLALAGEEHHERPVARPSAGVVAAPGWQTA